MRRRVLLLCTLGVALLIGSGRARAETQAGLEMAAIAGMRFHGPSQRMTERGMRIRPSLRVDERYFSFRGEARIRWNDAYRTSPAYSEEAKDAYRLAIDVRELYASTTIEGWTLSLGYQQVVWGKADELRVLDQVNPLDLREFILLDLVDYRVAVPMARLNGVLWECEIELVYLPFYRATRFAKPGSEFYFPLIDEQTLQAVDYRGIDRPSLHPRNGEVGGSVSRTIGPVDLSLVVFYTRDDLPVMRTTITQDQKGEPKVVLTGMHPRQLRTGFGLAIPTGASIVVRGEFSFVPDFTYMDADAKKGLREAPTLIGLLGVDYNYKDWQLSVQATDRHIFGWEKSFTAPRFSPILTASVTGTTFSAKLDLRGAVIYMPLNKGGSWVQLRAVYKPFENWSLLAGADVLTGAPSTFFGQFNRRDRVHGEVRYTF